MTSKPPTKIIRHKTWGTVLANKVATESLKHPCLGIHILGKYWVDKSLADIKFDLLFLLETVHEYHSLKSAW